MEEFEVLGWQKPMMGEQPSIIVCLINGKIWYVPDDMENRDRQRVAEWEAEGNTIPAEYTEPAPEPPPDEPEAA